MIRQNLAFVFIYCYKYFSIMNDTKGLKEAYKITINDLEIAIRRCGLFEFKQRRIYQNELKEYEIKLNCL